MPTTKTTTRATTFIKDRHMRIDATNPELRRVPGSVFYEYPSSRLKPTLLEYSHGDYTVQSFLENKGLDLPYRENPEFQGLHDHQKDAYDAIQLARNQGAPGFVLGDSTGFGKMVVAANIIRDAEIDTALVVAPKSSLNDWRQTIDDMIGNGGKNIVVVHYEALWDLFEYHDVLPLRMDEYPSTFIEHGELMDDLDFDLVVFDESHRVSNMETLRNTAIRKITEKTGAFALYTSATSFVANSDCYYLAPLLGWKYGIPKPRNTFDATGNVHREWFGNICEKLGLDVEFGKDNSYIAIQTDENDNRINELFFKEYWLEGEGYRRVGMARNPLDIGYPTQSRVRTPVRMDRAMSELYRLEWLEFRRWWDADTTGHNNPDGLLDSLLRAIQKASLIKVDPAIKRINELTSEGYQVIVVANYRETILDLMEKLLEQGINGDRHKRPTMLYGDISDEAKQKNIAAFNSETIYTASGEEFRIPVIVTSIVDAINLHESASNIPNPSPRYTLFVDVLLGGKRPLQAEGRGQRDSNEALAEYMYLENTVEERMLHRTISKMIQVQRKNAYDQDVDILENLQKGLDPDVGIPGFDDEPVSTIEDILKLIDSGRWQKP